MRGRAIAIGSAVVLGLGILTVSYSANAAETGCDPAGSAGFVNPCPKDKAMELCKGALKINGEDQEATEFAQTFPSDTCDLAVTEVLGASDAKPIFGEPFTPSAPLANCPPNTATNPSLTVSLEQGSAKISGDFVNDNDTFAVNLVGLVGIEWGKHTTRSTVTSEVRAATTSRTVNVPEGKKGTFQFVPRRAQIKGIWTVKGGTRGGNPLVPDSARPWEWSFETTIDAPLVLPDGNADGEARSQLTNCTGGEFEGDDPEPFPSEAPGN